MQRQGLQGAARAPMMRCCECTKPLCEEALEIGGRLCLACRPKNLGLSRPLRREDLSRKKAVSKLSNPIYRNGFPSVSPSASGTSTPTTALPQMSRSSSFSDISDCGQAGVSTLESSMQLSNAAPPQQQCFGYVVSVPVALWAHNQFIHQQQLYQQQLYQQQLCQQQLYQQHTQEQLVGHLRQFEGPIFFSPFGTKGDMLPLLFASVGFVADYGKNALFLTQPGYKGLIRQKMAATQFRQCQTTYHSAVGGFNRYTYKVPEMIEKNTDTRFVLSFHVERWVYDTIEGGQLTFLWMTDSTSGSGRKWDEDCYQAPFSVDDGPGRRLETYGEFLSHWQAVCGFVQSSMQKQAKFVTCQYASLSLAAKIEEAMGIDSALLLRVSGMCLADCYNEAHVRKLHYAMSSTLAPEELELHSSMVMYPHPEVKKQCHGVLGEAEHLFNRSLPQDLEQFLDRKATVVVTISSFGQVDKVARLFPSSDRFQVLFLGSDCGSEDPNHMHHHEPANLDAVFRRASLIVHGCGVGTINQVALSGKPSIGVSSFIEQRCNGLALENMGVSRHFTLKSLCSTDGDAANEFATCILSFFESPASFANPDRLEEVQRAVQTESASAFASFLNRVSEVCSC